MLGRVEFCKAEIWCLLFRLSFIGFIKIPEKLIFSISTVWRKEFIRDLKKLLEICNIWSNSMEDFTYINIDNRVTSIEGFISEL